MDFIASLVPVLRPLHIIFGIIWVGYGTMAAWIIHPLANQMGEEGNSFLRKFYAYSRYNKILPWGAIVTTIAGLLMWTWAVDGADWVNIGGNLTIGDWIMMTGTVFGLLAFGHGLAATGRFAGKYATIARAVEESDSPTQEQQDELATAREKLFLHGNISAWLTVIATLGMVSARYISI